MDGTPTLGYYCSEIRTGKINLGEVLFTEKYKHSYVKPSSKLEEHEPALWHYLEPLSQYDTMRNVS